MQTRAAVGVSRKPLRGFLRPHFLRALSYSRLCADPGFLANGYRPTILTWQGAALTICAFAAAVAISSASYLLIEGPLIRMAHRKFSFGEPKKVSKDLLTVVNV